MKYASLQHLTSYGIRAPCADVQIQHLDGHDVTLKSDGITIPGQLETLKGEGMPLLDSPRKRGDMHVTFTVAFPQQLNDSQRKCIQEMGHAFPIRDEL